MVDQKEKSLKRSQQRGDQDSVCLFNEFWHTVVVYYYGRHGWIRRDFILWGHSSVLASCPLVILWARTWVSPLLEPSLDDLEAFLWTDAIFRKITESSRLTCGYVGLLGHLVLLLLVPVVRLALLHLAHLDYLLCSTCQGLLVLIVRKPGADAGWWRGVGAGSQSHNPTTTLNPGGRGRH